MNIIEESYSKYINKSLLSHKLNLTIIKLFAKISMFIVLSFRESPYQYECFSIKIIVRPTTEKQIDLIHNLAKYD